MYNELQLSDQSQYIDFDSELADWFSVSGDTDDFIYYGDPEKPHSEK